MSQIDLNQLNSLISTKQGVLIYFTGQNCNVCHSLKPKIDKLFEQRFPKIERVFIDAHKQKDISTHFGVFSVPTILVFLDGKEFLREGRATSLSMIEMKLSRPYQILVD